MLTSLENVKKVIASTGIEYFRDDAPFNHEYPYLVYEYVSDIMSIASNKVIREIQEYQLSYITTGTESELNELKKAFNENNILFSPFKGGAYDENDTKVTQFISYVRCENERWI